MKLDLVHDIQKVYRKVINSMARPGLIENIGEQSGKVDIDTGFYNQTLVIMFMLLDAEVSFKIYSNQEEKITKFISQLTYAKSKSADEADFIFVLRDAGPKKLEEAFRKGKPGNLIDPHRSATIIVEVDKLSKDKDLVLKGPGIKDANYVKVDIEGDWIEERKKKNIEYPLGVDAIFIDRNSNIVAFPRTTQILR